VNTQQQERLAQNEAFFRNVNDNIRNVASQFASRDDPYEFVCECADSSCTMRMTLTLSEYEAVRASPVRFVLAPGHVVPEIETVVEQEQDHVVVEKHGAAGQVAAVLDATSS